jgi:glycosyltransferase involved in cell wall biosynthesis
MDETSGRIRVIRISTSGYEPHTELADWLTYNSMVSAEIQRVHQEQPIDLIEAPEWGCEAYVHLLNRTEWYSIPTVIQLHGPLVMLSQTIGWPAVDTDFFRIGRQMEERCVQRADAVYSSSACSAEWCAREYGLDRNAIPVLHTGVDTDHFSPRSVEVKARQTIVFAGKLTWNKGVRPLLQATLDLAPQFPGLRLRMLGRGEPQVVAELRKMAASAGCEHVLEMPGFVHHDDLSDEFSGAQIFAAPSRYEGGPGFVYLEAMACGLPVIACAGSGASEVVHDGQTGLLVPPDDITALTAALRRLLLNSRERQAMGSRARDYVLEHADSRKCLEQLEAFFGSVINRARGVSV